MFLFLSHVAETNKEKLDYLQNFISVLRYDVNIGNMG